MTRKIYWGTAALLWSLSACTPEVEEKSSEREAFCLNHQLKKATEIIEVKEQPITEQLTLSGKIDYDENNMVAFRSLLEGVVESVSFELGDQVKQGQVLATIKSAQIQELYQQKRFQENQIVLLKKQTQSTRELAADGLATTQDVLAVEHELESAILELERINESLSLYRAAGKDAFHLLAPKNGYIIQKSISPGQSVTGDSEPLFSISNLKEVWVMVNIYATNLRHVQVGNKVKVRTIAYPDKFYDGKIDKIYNTFDDNEHVLKARVVLPNPNMDLMPGLSADIVIDLNRKDAEMALAIPNRAKVFSNNKEYMVVYRDSCDMDVRPITILGDNEEYTYVKEKLHANEMIVGTNALLIFEQLNQ